MDTGFKIRLMETGTRITAYKLHVPSIRNTQFWQASISKNGVSLQITTYKHFFYFLTDP